MRSVERQIRLYALLRRPGGASAGELSAALGVPARFVHREVAALADAGAPIESVPAQAERDADDARDDDESMRWRVPDDARLELGALDPDEALALIVALGRTARFGDEPVASSAAGLLERVSRLFPAERRARVARGARGGDEDEAARALVDAWREEIRRAIRERRCVRLAYREAAGPGRERVVQPLGLLPPDETSSFVGWCRRREAFRRFRLDRIEALHVTDEVFPVTSGRELDDFLGGVVFRA